MSKLNMEGDPFKGSEQNLKNKISVFKLSYRLFVFLFNLCSNLYFHTSFLNAIVVVLGQGLGHCCDLIY